MIILFTSRNIASAGIARMLVAEHGFVKSRDNEWRYENKKPIISQCPPASENTRTREPTGQESGLARPIELDWKSGYGKKQHSPARESTEQPRFPSKNIQAGDSKKYGVRMIDTNAPTVLEIPTDFDEPILVLSTHRSKTPGRMLTAHVPGNWGNAEMGGEPRTLNIAPASRLKALIIALKKEGDRIGWPVSLEADHHGPTCDTPIMFVEIGNGEEQWQDEEAARAVANAVMASLENDREYETVFGVGGGHYSKAFTMLALETDFAVGHMAPKYAIDGMDEEMFRHAIGRNVERVSRVVVLKDETNAAQRKKIMEFAEKAGLPVEIK